MISLTKIARRLTKSGAVSSTFPDSEISMTKETDDRPGGLSLADRELIGFMEALDKRVSSLEHDLWVVRKKIAEMTQEEKRVQ